MKRPPKATVQTAILAADGNLSRAAASLHCSRPALYEWIWQYGLQHFAGVDTHERKERKTVAGESSNDGGHTILPVKTEGACSPRLHGVMTAEAVAPDLKFGHNVRVRDSVWVRAQHAAVDLRISISEFVERALVQALDHPEDKE